MLSSNLDWKVSHPVKNCPAVFAPRGLLDELLKKFSNPGLGHPMDFIPWDPSCCSFHTLVSFLLPWYPALKMTTPLESRAFFLCANFKRLSIISDVIKSCWRNSGMKRIKILTSPTSKTFRVMTETSSLAAQIFWPNLNSILFF